MGRRPGLKGAELQAMMSGFPPELQDKINAIGELLLEEFFERLKEKRDGATNAFKQLTLPELLKELRSFVKAIQRPATSLQQINIPQAPQLPAQDARQSELDASVQDPAKLEKLRESQQKHLEKKDASPQE